MAGIELKKAEPETVGLSKERITEFVGRLHEAEIPLHSLIVIKDDRLVFEAYQKPYGPDELHRMFSVTKSMVSLAIGLLADEGKLSLDDHIVDYFPEKLPEHVHPYIKALTIRNMLTMRACIIIRHTSLQGVRTGLCLFLRRILRIIREHFTYMIHPPHMF